MPELNLKIGYDITPNLRAYVGYDFLFISSVVRPAEQIDLHVNLNQIHGGVDRSVLVDRNFRRWRRPGTGGRLSLRRLRPDREACGSRDERE